MARGVLSNRIFADVPMSTSAQHSLQEGKDQADALRRSHRHHCLIRGDKRVMLFVYVRAYSIGSNLCSQGCIDVLMRKNYYKHVKISNSRSTSSTSDA